MTSLPSACERLAQSRERLRQAMHQVTPPQGEASQRCCDRSASVSQASPKATPGSNLLWQVLQAWCLGQPLQEALARGSEAAKQVLQPVAQRHPYGLVLGAAAAGGLFVLLRPWRWCSAQSLPTSNLLGQLLSLVIERWPTQVPMQTPPR